MQGGHRVSPNAARARCIFEILVQGGHRVSPNAARALCIRILCISTGDSGHSITKLQRIPSNVLMVFPWKQILCISTSYSGHICYMSINMHKSNRVCKQRFEILVQRARSTGYSGHSITKLQRIPSNVLMAPLCKQILCISTVYSELRSRFYRYFTCELWWRRGIHSWYIYIADLVASSCVLYWEEVLLIGAMARRDSIGGVRTLSRSAGAWRSVVRSRPRSQGLCELGRRCE